MKGWRPIFWNSAVINFMRTPDKVYINLSFDSETRQSIINRLSEYDVHFGDSESFSPEDEKKFLESAIMFGWCDSKLLESNTNLKWIQLDSVGYGQYQNVKWKDSSVHPRVTNLRFLFAMKLSMKIEFQ